jgi:hypothetical protein
MSLCCWRVAAFSRRAVTATGSGETPKGDAIAADRQKVRKAKRPNNAPIKLQASAVVETSIPARPIRPVNTMPERRTGTNLTTGDVRSSTAIKGKPDLKRTLQVAGEGHEAGRRKEPGPVGNLPPIKLGLRLLRAVDL